jgi:Holliday junction resolvasome RuvABC endonuclease subunit
VTTVIAIDPSLSATGLCVWRTGQPLFLSTVQTTRWETFNGWTDAHRFDRISKAITNFVEPGATAVTIEGMIKPSQEAARGTSTLDLAQLRGVITTDLFRLNIPINVVHPSTLKSFAVKGGAPKAALVSAARTVLGTEFTIDNDNEADAFWLMAMTLQAYGYPVVRRTPNRVRACAVTQWWHFNLREAQSA